MRLASVDAFEAFSHQTGEGLLVVDLRSDSDGSAAGARSQVLPEALLERAIENLKQLPCPTLAISSQTLDGVGRRLLGLFDVALEDEAIILELADRVRARPMASAALVGLLRMQERLDPAQGLIAESLTYSTLQSGPEFAEWLAEQPRRELPRASGPLVLAEREGSAMRVTLNRSERRNAFCARMRDELAEVLAVVVADDSVERIVLDGKGPTFCSGGDLAEFGTLPDPATAHAIRATRNVARMLAACSNRLVAQVHGACVGAGVELAAFAGQVSADPATTFQLPEVSMGLVPGAGGTVSLARRIGRQRTAYLALSGAPIDVPTATAWGLVDRDKHLF